MGGHPPIVTGSPCPDGLGGGRLSLGSRKEEAEDEHGRSAGNGFRPSTRSFDACRNIIRARGAGGDPRRPYGRYGSQGSALGKGWRSDPSGSWEGSWGLRFQVPGSSSTEKVQS